MEQKTKNERQKKKKNKKAQQKEEIWRKRKKMKYKQIFRLWQSFDDKLFGNLN